MYLVQISTELPAILTVLVRISSVSTDASSGPFFEHLYLLTFHDHPDIT
jgi:hypothetical protein